MKILLIFLLISLNVSAMISEREALRLTITDIGPSKGQLLIALFNDPREFPQGKPSWTKVITSLSSNSVDFNNEDSLTFSWDLPPGEYALSVFLDENKNGILDKNFLGIPKEKFGFSQNPPIRMGAPSFEECLFSIHEDAEEMKVKLIKLL